MTNLRPIFSAGVWACLAVGSTELLLVEQLSHQALAAEAAAPVSVALSTASKATVGATLERASASSALTAAPADGVLVAQQLYDTYRLGPGDSITVDIFNVPEYSGQQDVLADGFVNLQAAGLVDVSGLTLQEAGAAIASAYQSELRYPQVTVVLNTPRDLRVAISGEVSEPGLYTLTPENNAQFPTVAQALQEAGGVTQAADLRQVQLRRRRGDGGFQTISLDLWQLLNNGDVRQDIALRDGDALVITETDTVNIAETNQLSASNLAASAEAPIVIAVVGEVFRPGAYEFGSGSASKEAGLGRTTVTQVVQTAGGVKPSADIRQIQVRRLTRSGAEQLIDLDFWQLLQAGDLSQDLVLQQGDTVVIPVATDATPGEIAQLTAANFSPDEVRVNVVGEVEKPGVLQVPPNTTLNQ
ncbi:MAG: SLBB domain-containing protein, partial [Cyanobacteria bacterium J06598_3]